MDQTSIALNVGVPLGIISTTIAAAKWTALPKWGVILGGLTGGIIMGILYAIPIFFLIGWLGALIPATKEEDTDSEQGT